MGQEWIGRVEIHNICSSEMVEAEFTLIFYYSHTLRSRESGIMRTPFNFLTDDF